MAQSLSRCIFYAMQSAPIPVRIVIFDFDGVIVESNAIKDQAFYTLYLPFGEAAARRAFQIHLQNPGASRFEKFAMIHRALLDREITPAESIELGERFSALCFEAVCSCPMVAGAEEFLTKYSGRLVLALASATPEEELMAIVQRRGLAPYFRYACGKPRSKVESLNHILRCERVKREEAVFVGDQTSDRDAALQAGIAFVRRVTVSSDDTGLPSACTVTNIMQLGGLLAL
jgi:phosphoglycolate phosphatase-like HAD superfamily hydrolase